MTLSGYTLVETLVALALTSIVAAAALRGVERLSSADLRYGSEAAADRSLAEAVDALREDLWSAQTVAHGERESIHLLSGYTRVTWTPLGDSAARRLVTHAGGKLREVFPGRMRIERQGDVVFVEFCRFQDGRVFERYCARASTELRKY